MNTSPVTSMVCEIAGHVYNRCSADWYVRRVNDDDSWTVLACCAVHLPDVILELVPLDARRVDLRIDRAGAIR